MKIEYHRTNKRKKLIGELWIQIASDYNSNPDITVDELRKKYINPKTKKPYTRGYIYWVLKKVQTLVIN